MADYTPIYVPGKVFTSTASAAVTGGDILEVSGSGTVAKTATLAAGKIVGVAADDTPINGRVTVYGRGIIHESVADGTVTAGDQVTSTATANRQVKTLAAASTAVAADINNARAVLGIALTTVADNAKVRWMET